MRGAAPYPGLVRPGPLPYLLLGSALLWGCGDGRAPTPALAPVRLTIDGPQDMATVESGTIEVHGRVEPATARVLIDGDVADVQNGSFSTTVALEPSANVIDVQAGAPRHPAAMTALRVVRRVPVEIPELAGQPPRDAVRALEAVGLAGEVSTRGGILDRLLLGSEGICDSDPAAGERVPTGTLVHLTASKAC